MTGWWRCCGGGSSGRWSVVSTRYSVLSTQLVHLLSRTSASGNQGRQWWDDRRFGSKWAVDGGGFDYPFRWRSGISPGRRQDANSASQSLAAGSADCTRYSGGSGSPFKRSVSGIDVVNGGTTAVRGSNLAGESGGFGYQFRGLSGNWVEISVRISKRGSFFLDLGMDWGRILLYCYACLTLGAGLKVASYHRVNHSLSSFVRGFIPC